MPPPVSARQQTSGTHQSVLTGSLHSLAVFKLAVFELARYFDLRIGAFGGDGLDRTQLARHAWRRAYAMHPVTDSAVRRRSSSATRCSTSPPARKPAPKSSRSRPDGRARPNRLPLEREVVLPALPRSGPPGLCRDERTRGVHRAVSSERQRSDRSLWSAREHTALLN